MPLAWAHAEFVKLLVSRELGHAFDRPAAVWRRYRGHRPLARQVFWFPHAPIATMPAGARLVVALNTPAIVHWGIDSWHALRDEPTTDTGLSFHAAALDTSALAPGTRIDFTWRSTEGGEWHHRDEAVEVSDIGGTHPNNVVDRNGLAQPLQR